MKKSKKNVGRKKDPHKADQDSFERFVKEIQERITKEEQRTYSKQVRAEAAAPKNLGKLENPEATGAVTGECGDTMILDLKMKGPIIIDARFRTDGCAATLACGSMLTKMIIGRTMKEARSITNLVLEEQLGGLPNENKHCAVLAVKVLNKALENFKKKDAVA